MSTFQSERFQWRETYFVLFESSRRPTLEQVKQTLAAIPGRFQITDVQADEQGRFESLTILSPDDFAALDVSYLAGEEVVEQCTALAEEFKPSESVDSTKLARLVGLDARFDVMHFEQLIDTPPEEESDELLDPSALLVVLEALIELTGGVGVDPQSGSLL